MSDPDSIYVLPGAEPILWAYPSQVHAGGGHDVAADATGTGSVSCSLVVTLRRTASGDGVVEREGIHSTLTSEVTGHGTVEATVLAPGEHAVEAVAVGSGSVTFDLLVTPRAPASAGGGNRYPTRLRPWERDDVPDDEPDREDDDVEALIVLGAL